MGCDRDSKRHFIALLWQKETPLSCASASSFRVGVPECEVVSASLYDHRNLFYTARLVTYCQT